MKIIKIILVVVIFLSLKNNAYALGSPDDYQRAAQQDASQPNTQQGLDALESQSYAPNTQQGLDKLESQSSSTSNKTSATPSGDSSTWGYTPGPYTNTPSSSSLGSFSIPSVNLPTPSHGILGIVANLLYWLLAILSLVGIIGFVISGIMYLVSTGDDDAIKRAKKGMTSSIIGVVVGLSGVIIIRAVYMALSGSYNF